MFLGSSPGNIECWCRPPVERSHIHWSRMTQPLSNTTLFRPNNNNIIIHLDDHGALHLSHQRPPAVPRAAVRAPVPLGADLRLPDEELSEGSELAPGPGLAVLETAGLCTDLLQLGVLQQS